MNIETIEDKIKYLEKISLEADKHIQLRDNVILAYTWKVIKELKIIVSDHENDLILIKKIKSFLKNNWDLVKGSLLSYTALPESEITQLLFDLAEYVVEKEELAPIKILMPGVSCDSLFPGQYPNLDLLDTDKLRTGIKTHVLSQNHTFLIPVSLLTKANIASTIDFPNVYFDLDDDPASEYLTAEDLELLSNHSDVTKAIWNTRNQYKALSENKDNLLGQLNILNKAIMYNSKTGIGQEKDGGNDIYSAILNFNEYWQKLSECWKKLSGCDDLSPELLSKISGLPSEFLLEINKLLDLATPQQEKVRNQGRNHRNMLDTCLANRRKALEKAIEGHEVILSDISLTAEQRENQISEAKKELQESVESLRNSLDSGSYSGQEHRGFTIKVLQDLKIDLNFNSLDELISALKGISAQEITAICELENSPEKIVKAISNIENLVLLTTELNDKVLESLLRGVKGNITNIVQSYRDFLAFLIPLSVNQCAAVCEALKEKLPEIIKKGKDFRDVLQHLTPEQRTAVYETLKEKLPDITKNGNDFKNVLQHLTPEQRTAVYEAAKRELPKIIKKGEDFRDVLQYLIPEQRTAVYEALKEKLPDIIKECGDFFYVLQHLTPEQRTVVYEAAKRKLPEIVKQKHDLINTLKYLAPDQCAAVCKMLKEQLLEILKTSHGFKDALKDLTSEQCTAVCESVKSELPKFIKNSYDFNDVLKNLTSEQCTAVCEMVKKRLHEIIKKGYDFSIILKDLSSIQCAAVCKVLKERLLEIIKSDSYISDVLKSFTLEQRIAVEVIQGKPLPLAIVGSDVRIFSFSNILKSLTPDQCATVCEVLKEQLPLFIKSCCNFNNVLKNLTSGQCTAVCNALQRQLLEIIKDSYDFKAVLTDLTPDQCATVCQSIEGQLLSKIIKSSYGFRNALESLTPDQRTAVYETIKEQLPSVIKDINDLKSVLEVLTPSQCAAICESVKSKLSVFIKSTNDFNVVLKNLTCEQRAIVYEALKELLLPIKGNYAFFKDDLKSEKKILPAQYSAVCKH